MSRPKIQRRTFLRGLAGSAAVSLGLPLFEAMLDESGSALADGTPLPCRLITFMIGNGVRLDRWVPTSTGSGYALTPELAPLVDVKDYCSVLSGFRHYLTGGNAHMNGLFGSFYGHPAEYYDPTSPFEAGATGPSIDQVAADVIGKDSYLRSLEVGNSKYWPEEGGGYLSSRGPDRPNPPILNPQALYKRLFVGPDETSALRASLLDAVLEDAKALRTRLGTSDGQRLDAHLQSVADLERRITAIPPPCQAPTMPAATNEDVNGQEPLVETAEAMADLVAVALACDLTRVVSFQQSGKVCQSIYHMTGATLDNHTMSHDGAPDVQDLIHKAVIINMEAFAYFLGRLRDTADGSGNLLDNAVVLLGSDVAEGLSHESRDMPFIVAGRGAGKLRYPGIHHRSSSEDNASDVLLTCLRAAVPEVASVGSGAGYSESTVSAIEVG